MMVLLAIQKLFSFTRSELLIILNASAVVMFRKSSPVPNEYRTIPHIIFPQIQSVWSYVVVFDLFGVKFYARWKAFMYLDSSVCSHSV